MATGKSKALFGAVIALLIAALSSCGFHSTGASDRNAIDTLSGWNTPSSGWGGTATSAGDTWVYQDYVYDDYGADTCQCGQSSVVRNAAPDGDYRYPAGANYANNAADILAVRLRPEGRNGAKVQVTMNTLIDPNVPALLVVANGLEGVFSTASGNVLIDVYANTMTFVLENTGNTLELFIGAGLSDGKGGLAVGEVGLAQISAQSFTTGGPAESGLVGSLFDVAFNHEQFEVRGGAWNEAFQAQSLATGDINSLFQVIDLQGLRIGNGPRYVPEPGYHVAIFESALRIGEGVDTESFPHYLGTHQPYAVWIPSNGPQERLILTPHSRSEHHNQYRGGTSFSFRSFYEQLGDGTQSIMITPLARSPEGWYEREALIDTLEVWADALTRFPSIDLDSVHLVGYSMGGYGAYKIGMMLPEAFTSASVMAGPMTNGVWPYPLPPTSGSADGPDNTYMQLESLRNVPISIKHGTNDELVPVTGVLHQVDRIAELGLEFRFDLFPGEGHLFFPFTDDWSLEQDWILSHPQRAATPARVSLKVRPATWLTAGAASIVQDEELMALLHELASRVGANLRSAYWVQDVALRHGDDLIDDRDQDHPAEIDLRSNFYPARNWSESSSELGLSGNWLTRPYVRRESVSAEQEPTSGFDISGVLKNVASLSIDLDIAGVPAGQLPSFELDTGGESTNINLIRNGHIVQRLNVIDNVLVKVY